ncbi:MAG: hypothetical protein MJ114_04470 [Acetatifactor sp.]|nr:hypothetical protein [Acetatifactor sp.]
MKLCLWVVVILCFLAATVQDIRTKTVVNLLWVISGMAGLLLNLLNFSTGVEGHVGEVIFFCGVQLLLFSRFYGKADVYAFCVCAIVLHSLGDGLKEYLVLSLLAIGYLALVQICRRNVRKDGNLKVPVAFLPYITLALLTSLCYHIMC